VSDAEERSGNVRKAFYENRWAGRTGAKPEYKSYSTQAARSRALQSISEGGLPHGWRGNGHPTYHGGGRRQFQHTRVSKYTMMSDWLFDVQSIASGEKNMPNMMSPKLLETFYAVGDAYDAILDATGALRMSIIAGYLSPSNPFFCAANDWRTGTATFSIVPPEGMSCKDVRMNLLFSRDSRIIGFGSDEHVLDITVKV
jgi:hypothetical protein